MDRDLERNIDRKIGRELPLDTLKRELEIGEFTDVSMEYFDKAFKQFINLRRGHQYSHFEIRQYSEVRELLAKEYNNDPEFVRDILAYGDITPSQFFAKMNKDGRLNFYVTQPDFIRLIDVDLEQRNADIEAQKRIEKREEDERERERQKELKRQRLEQARQRMQLKLDGLNQTFTSIDEVVNDIKELSQVNVIDKLDDTFKLILNSELSQSAVSIYNRYMVGGYADTMPAPDLKNNRDPYVATWNNITRRSQHLDHYDLSKKKEDGSDYSNNSWRVRRATFQYHLYQFLNSNLNDKIKQQFAKTSFSKIKDLFKKDTFKKTEILNISSTQEYMKYHNTLKKYPDVIPYAPMNMKRPGFAKLERSRLSKGFGLERLPDHWIDNILTQTQNKTHRDAILAMALTGCRISELPTIQYTQTKDGNLLIQHDIIKTAQYLGNEKSIRILIDGKHSHAKHFLDRIQPGQVYSLDLSKYRDYPKALQRYFTRHKDKFTFNDVSVSAHTFRHQRKTDARNQGMDDKEIKLIGGHLQDRTSNLYGHKQGAMVQTAPILKIMKA
jgi:hypothetical protein